MVIRRAIASDKQELFKKLAEFDTYLAPLFPKELAPFVNYKDKTKTFEEIVTEWLNNPEYILFVAEDDGNLVGHICGTIKTKKFQVKDKEGSVEEWFVSEQYRHKGTGKQLYEALLTEFRKAQCTHIGLKVFVDNKSTIDMYRKMGFVDLELTLIKELE